MGLLIRSRKESSKNTIPVLSHFPLPYRKSGKCGKNRTSRNFPNSGNVGNVGNVGKPVFIGLQRLTPMLTCWVMPLFWSKRTHDPKPPPSRKFCRHLLLILLLHGVSG
jgi:hypothetical protein